MNSEELVAEAGKHFEGMLSSGIYIDEEGDWYYQEVKITREDILELFLTNLCLTSGGLFFIAWKGQRCALEVADTPFLITRVDRVRSQEGQGEEILIRMKYLPGAEILDPATLQIGKDNIPYCRIRNGQYRARFSRPAYYQLATWIAFDPVMECFYLELNGIRHSIAEAAPS